MGDQEKIDQAKRGQAFRPHGDFQCRVGRLHGTGKEAIEVRCELPAGHKGRHVGMLPPEFDGVNWTETSWEEEPSATAQLRELDPLTRARDQVRRQEQDDLAARLAERVLLAITPRLSREFEQLSGRLKVLEGLPLMRVEGRAGGRIPRPELDEEELEARRDLKMAGLPYIPGMRSRREGEMHMDPADRPDRILVMALQNMANDSEATLEEGLRVLNRIGERLVGEKVWAERVPPWEPEAPPPEGDAYQLQWQAERLLVRARRVILLQARVYEILWGSEPQTASRA